MANRPHWYEDDSLHPTHNRRAAPKREARHSCPDCPDCDHYRALDALLTLPLAESIKPDDELSDEAVAWWRKVIHRAKR